MGHIQISVGGYADGATSESNLIQAHINQPDAGFDKIISLAEKRMLMTMLVAGARSGKYTAPRMTGPDTVKTKIDVVPKGELLDGNAWKFRIQGRIQAASEILSQVGIAIVGTTTTGGKFSLIMATGYLKYGMNVVFHNRKIARVMSHGRATGGGFKYDFEAYPGETFSWAIWVAPQTGMKTCFGSFSTYGERSLKGYDVQHFPDSFINHMTTQRKGFDISGDANSLKIKWYSVEKEKGWVYEQEAQARQRFLLEDDFQKKWGISNMKDANGNLLPVSPQTDPETGEPITTGDGLYTQIAGANDMEASGTDGTAVWDDFKDMNTELSKHKINMFGTDYVVVTGTEGLENIDEIGHARWKDQYNLTENKDNAGDEFGVIRKGVGYVFRKLNIGGNSYTFVVDPMMDDKSRFPATLSNGKSVMGNTYYFLNFAENDNGEKNIEIRARGRDGVNRDFVYFVENGMTGEGKAMSSIDARKTEMLKQNMIICRYTKSCGIMTPPNV